MDFDIEKGFDEEKNNPKSEKIELIVVKSILLGVRILKILVILGLGFFVAKQWFPTKKEFHIFTSLVSFSQNSGDWEKVCSYCPYVDGRSLDIKVAGALTGIGVFHPNVGYTISADQMNKWCEDYAVFKNNTLIGAKLHQ